MSEKARPTRDAFAFSLRGMRTIASFALPPVVADDRIRKLQDEGSKQDRELTKRRGQIWRLGRRRPAQDCP
jgi:hypothetical protein